MDCRDACDRLAAWLDGELAPTEAEQFQAHVAACGSCRALLDRVSAQALRPPPFQDITGRPGFWTRTDAVLARELDRMESRSRLRSTLRARLSREFHVPALAVAGWAALLLAALSWGLYNLGGARNARRQAEDLRVELDRERRLASQPSEPEPLYGYSLATYTPYRGTL